MKRLLDDICVSISVSLDDWTSPNNEAFLGIIGHWIGPDSLKVGVHKDVYKIFDDLENKCNVESIGCVMKIRALSIYVKESPQRQKEWLKVVPHKQQKKYIETMFTQDATLHIE